jgi:hypothetical protein
MFLSAGQTSDYIGARAMLSLLPQAKVLLADRGYDADWFRDALADRGIAPASPPARVAPCLFRTTPSTTGCAIRSR